MAELAIAAVLVIVFLVTWDPMASLRTWSWSGLDRSGMIGGKLVKQRCDRAGEEDGGIGVKGCGWAA